MIIYLLLIVKPLLFLFSHMQEIRQMEARYKEEIKTLELRLCESEKRRERLETGKKEIAQKLHGVMEAQWQQALSILTSEISVRQVWVLFIFR